MHSTKIKWVLMMLFSVLVTTSCKPIHIEIPARTKEIPQWEYEGEFGPEYWGAIDPTNKSCASGSEQSPIDFVTEEIATNEKFQPISVYYQKSKVKVIHNGHTIMVNVDGDQNTYNVDGIVYRLKQFHFHTPSEHTFNEATYPMELHFVHQNEFGQYAVIGVMLEVGEKAQTELQKIWSVMPPVKTDDVVELAQKIDLKLLLPEDMKSYRYHGSLTTPPCTEGVSWTVLRNPLFISNEQFEQFKSIFPMNSRPVQKVNQRKVETEPIKKEKKTNVLDL